MSLRNNNAAFPRRAAAKMGRFLSLAILSLAVASFPAAAATITVGLLSFDELIPGGPGAPGVNGFTIYNFTGSNSQPGTPDSTISFLSASVSYDSGAHVTSVGAIDPGSAQPASLQFPDTQAITDAVFKGTLSSDSFTIAGQSYLASTSQVTADLLPSSPPDLQAGVDFVVIDIQATPVVAGVPEPASAGLILLAAALAAPVLRRRKLA